jgi:small subunit ribosomal protein S10
MTTAAAKKQKIRIRLKGYDYRVVDRVTKEIVETAQRTGARVVAIPLPTRIERFTVLSSPHVNKKSREQFEMRTHKRLLEIRNPTSSTIDKLKSYTIPSAVNITISA